MLVKITESPFVATEIAGIEGTVTNIASEFTFYDITENGIYVLLSMHPSQTNVDCFKTRGSEVSVYSTPPIVAFHPTTLKEFSEPFWTILKVHSKKMNLTEAFEIFDNIAFEQAYSIHIPQIAQIQCLIFKIESIADTVRINQAFFTGFNKQGLPRV